MQCGYVKISKKIKKLGTAKTKTIPILQNIKEEKSLLWDLLYACAIINYKQNQIYYIPYYWLLFIVC